MKQKPEDLRYLLMSSNDPKFHKYSMFFVQKFVDEKSGSHLRLVKKLVNGDILILATLQQCGRLIPVNKFLNDIEIRISEHPTLNQSQGIVKDRELNEITEEEIFASTIDQNVISVRHFKKIVNGEPKSTASYLFTFGQPTAPKEVKILFCTFPVKPFVASPLRCFNCWQFGHISSNCKKSVRICDDCGDSWHKTDKKPKCNKKPKCVNCNKSHSSRSKECPEYQKEVEIQTIRTKQRLSYGKAIKRHAELQDEKALALMQLKKVKQPVKGKSVPGTSTAAGHGNGSCKNPHHQHPPNPCQHRCQHHHHQHHCPEEEAAVAEEVKPEPPKPVKKLKVGNVTLLPKNLSKAQKRRIMKQSKAKN